MKLSSPTVLYTIAVFEGILYFFEPEMHFLGVLAIVCGLGSVASAIEGHK